MKTMAIRTYQLHLVAPHNIKWILVSQKSTGNFVTALVRIIGWHAPLSSLASAPIG